MSMVQWLEHYSVVIMTVVGFLVGFRPTTGVIPYLAGKVQVFAQRFVPRRVVTGAVERLFRPAALK